MKIGKKLRINWIWISPASLIIKYKLNIDLDKNKPIIFGTKFKIQRAEPSNIVYGNVKIKQHFKFTDLGCILDESFSEESMGLHVLNKIKSRLKDKIDS